ncbi:MAG: hypothetical protein QM747_17465 [Nocardioides sp.]
MTGGTDADLTVGERFATALASKDRDTLVELFGVPLDFWALTPGRHWVATDGATVIDDYVLGHWFGPHDNVETLEKVTSDRVGTRGHVAYRLRVRRDGTLCAVEQQMYFDVGLDGRIGYARMLCSGYCPVG